jgi:hypothetical protein
VEVDAKHLNGVVAGLLALYEATNGSINAHVPEPAFRSKLGRDFKQHSAKILKWLKKYGFAYVKGGTDSWAITQQGIDYLRKRRLVS